MEQERGFGIAENERASLFQSPKHRLAMLLVTAYFVAIGIQACTDPGPPSKEIHNAEMGERWRCLVDTPSALSPGIGDSIRYPGGTVPAGETVTIVEIRTVDSVSWFRVKLHNGKLVWVPRTDGAWRRVLDAE